MNESEPLNLVLLQTFHEVARTGSVGTAAERMHRSQPAISHRLRALEQDLGVSLFEKVGRRLKLTEHGQALLERCDDMMAMSGAIRRAFAGQQPAEGALVVGTLPTVASHLLAPRIGAFVAKYPLVQLSFVLDLGAVLLEHLRAGVVDVALLVGAPDAPRVQLEPLGTMGLVAVFPAGVPLANPRVVSPAVLKQHGFLAWSGLADPTMALVEQYAQRHGLMGPGIPRIPHIETLRVMVECGSGCTILPGYTVWRDHARGAVQVRRLRGLEQGVPLYMATRRSGATGPAFAALTTLLRDAAAGLGNVAASA